MPFKLEENSDSASTFSPVHRIVRNFENKPRICVLCKLHSIKTVKGWKVYSRFHCDICDVPLCTGERDCFEQYHRLLELNPEFFNLKKPSSRSTPSRQKSRNSKVDSDSATTGNVQDRFVDQPVFPNQQLPYYSNSDTDINWCVFMLYSLLVIKNEYQKLILVEDKTFTE